MIKCPVCLQEFEDGVEQCSSCGFKFSGATTSFKPIKAEHDVPSVDTSNVKDSSDLGGPILRIIKGPQGELVMPLLKDKITIGRSPDSDIFLNDRTVSRNHAIVTINNNKTLIADCNSFNGVWVNNNNVETAELSEGDIIQIGIFLLRYEKSV